MFSTGRFRPAIFAFGLIACAVPLAAQQPAPDPTFYRLFLKDGGTLVSYGEYARVADRVVFSMPLGGTPASPTLQLLSIPAASVDWSRTDAYAESARATRYAATEGPNDYALLGESVQRALSDIAVTTDPSRKISMALEARQNVTRWIASHFGYRATDVARMASMFDDVVAEVRKQAGQPNYDLSLIANMAAPPEVPLLGAPTLRESIEEGYRAASMTPDPAERTSLLKAIQHALRAAPRGSWADELRVRVDRDVRNEAWTDHQYALLTRRVLHAADRYARDADVTALTRLSARVVKQDDRYGHKRPEEAASLLAAVDAKLDAARRLRLARDAWLARAGVLRAYRSAVARPVANLREVRHSLQQIRQLAGPSSATLSRLPRVLDVALDQLSVVKPPAEIESVQSLFVNAAQLARRAIDGRRAAVADKNMQQAWDASSAASGALMLLDRAEQELRERTELPQLK